MRAVLLIMIPPHAGLIRVTGLRCLYPPPPLPPAADSFFAEGQLLPPKFVCSFSVECCPRAPCHVFLQITRPFIGTWTRSARIARAFRRRRKGRCTACSTKSRKSTRNFQVSACVSAFSQMRWCSACAR